MKKWKNNFIVVCILLMLTSSLISYNASALSFDEIWKGSKVTKMAGIGGTVVGIGVDWIMKGWIAKTLRDVHIFFKSIYKNLPYLILANPKVEDLAPGFSFFMRLIIPFYILAILITATYIIFSSGSPEGRAIAKGNLFKLFYSLILISLSPLLLNLLFIFSSSTAGMIMNLVDKNIAINAMQGATDYFYTASIKLIMIDRGGEGGTFWTGLLTVAYYLFYIIIAGRYVFVTFFGMMLPLSILLISFFSTRGLGMTLIKQTIMVTIVQIFWAIALVVIATAVLTISAQANIPSIHVSMISWFVFFLSPLMILGIMDWFVVMVVIIDSLTTGPLCVGPVVMDELYAGREVLPEEIVADVEDM